jgi:hypothetical protein
MNPTAKQCEKYDSFYLALNCICELEIWIKTIFDKKPKSWLTNVSIAGLEQDCSTRQYQCPVLKVSRQLETAGNRYNQPRAVEFWQMLWYEISKMKVPPTRCRSDPSYSPHYPDFPHIPNLNVRIKISEDEPR